MSSNSIPSATFSPPRLSASAAACDGQTLPEIFGRPAAVQLDDLHCLPPITLFELHLWRDLHGFIPFTCARAGGFGIAGGLRQGIWLRLGHS